MEASGQLHAMVTLFPGENTNNHWTDGWVGLIAGLHAVAKTENPLPARN